MLHHMLPGMLHHMLPVQSSTGTFIYTSYTMSLFNQLKIHVNYLSKVLNSRLKIGGNLNTYLRFP